jgi:hypothetical protein
VWMHQPGRPLVFNHVPKAAGTALREALVDAIAPESIALGFDGSVFGSFTDMGKVSRRLRRLVYADPTDIPLDAQFVSGHVSPSTTMARFPDAPHLTVLREPRARVVSFWLYTRSRPAGRRRMWGPLGDTFLLAKGSLADFLAADVVAPGTDNFMTRFLLWPHPRIPADGFIDPADDELLVAEALEKLGRFGHVGLVEDPALTAGIGTFLGVDVTMPVRNQGVFLADGDRELVEPEVEKAADALERCTRLDRALWSHVVTQRMPDADPQELAEATFRRSVRRYRDAPPISMTARPSFFRRAVRKLLRVTGLRA